MSFLTRDDKVAQRQRAAVQKQFLEEQMREKELQRQNDRQSNEREMQRERHQLGLPADDADELLAARVRKAVRRFGKAERAAARGRRPGNRKP
jgi:cell shape-determining protein MreC